MVKYSGKGRRILYLTLIALFLLLGIIRGISVSRGEYVNYESLSSPLKFTFLYPRGWKVIESERKKGEYHRVQILRPGKKKNIYKHTFVIAVSPLRGKKDSSLKEKVSGYKKRQEQLFESFKLLSEKEIISGGQPAEEITASFRLPAIGSSPGKGLSLKSRRVFLQKGSHFYELGYEINANDFPRYAKAFDKLCRSFALQESLSREVGAKDIKIEKGKGQPLAEDGATEGREGIREEKSGVPKAAKVVYASPGLELKGKEKKEKEFLKKPKKRRIETLISMNFRRANLSAVLLYLSRMSGVAIAVDDRALKSLKNPWVSIYTVTPIPLLEALDLILKVKGMNYVVKGDYIWVMGKKKGGKVVTRAYKLKYGLRKSRPVKLTSVVEEK